MNYGERLRHARKLKGWSQNDLVEKSGVKQGTISKIERGGQHTSTFDILLAKTLGINPEWLATGTGEINLKTEKSNVEPIESRGGLVPLISFVQAGIFCEAIDNFQPYDAERWLSCPAPCSASTYALRVIGDSMTSPFPGQKTFPEGIIIFVDPEKAPYDGCKVIAKILETQEVTFKEYRFDAGGFWLMPLNPRYEKTKFIEGMHICGVVVFAGFDV